MDRRVALSIAAAGCVAAAAHAQSSCEQFRDRLAERIEADSKGLVLVIGPGSAAVPAGAKVVGTCEGGARKVLLFRSAAAAADWTAGGANTPMRAASAAAPAPVKAAAASAPLRAASAAARIASAAPPPVAARPAAPASVPAPAAAPVPVAAVGAEPAEASAPGAAVGAASIALDGVPASPARTALSELLRRHWAWIAVPAGLLLVALLWAWIGYRRAYDAQGLPRGPRLRA